MRTTRMSKSERATAPSTRLWSLLAAGVLALATAAAGCGPENARSCDVDSDCHVDEICADGRCAQTCTDDEDCDEPGAFCQPYFDPDREEEEQICTGADAADASDDRCSSDEDCEGLDAGPAVCGLNGRCILVDRKHAVRVTNASGESGAEIAAVYLLDGSDEVVGFGETLRYCPVGMEPPGDAGTGDVGPDTRSADAGPADTIVRDTGIPDGGDADTSPGDVSDTTDGSDGFEADTFEADTSAPNRCSMESPIDGTQPRLTDDETCIRGGRDGTARLGDGGELWVRFVDESGADIDLEPTHRVAVLEWGENCTGDSADADPYDLEVCTSDRESFTVEDCRRIRSGATGKTVVAVD